MAEESKTVTEPEGEATPDPRDEELSKAKAEAGELRRKNEEYEQLLTDPKYLEYLTASPLTPEDGKEKVEAVAAREDVDLESLSNKQLVDYIRRVMSEEIGKAVDREVKPLKQQTAVDRAVQQVREVAAKHDDYFDHRDQMMQLAKMHPSLHPEQLYVLAKANANKKPVRPSKPSIPPVGGAAVKGKAPEGFEAKFATAYRAAGFGES